MHFKGYILLINSRSLFAVIQGNWKAKETAWAGAFSENRFLFLANCKTLN